jgi:hypothetical protein
MAAVFFDRPALKMFTFWTKRLAARAEAHSHLSFPAGQTIRVESQVIRGERCLEIDSGDLAIDATSGGK